MLAHLDSRIIHEVIKTLITESRLDFCMARLDALRVIYYETKGLDAEISQVRDGLRLSGCSQHAQSIPMELARKGVPNTARRASCDQHRFAFICNPCHI